MPILIFLAIFIVVSLLIMPGIIRNGNKIIEESEKNRKTILNGTEYFTPTREISLGNKADSLFVDEAHRKIMIVNFFKNEKNIFKFSEIVECSIMEDGTTIQSGGVGRAIVGGIVGGGVGAIVGAATRPSKPVILSLSVRIVTSNIQNPLHVIPIITSETKRSSDQYRQGIELANEIYATLVSIINTNKPSI